MTEKQKLAIKRLELNKNTEIYVDYKNKEKTDDIQVVLDLLKEKDKQIDKLKKHNDDLLRKLRNRVKEVKKLEKYSQYKKEFSTLNKQLQNKDKQIDLMSEKIAFSYKVNCIEDIKTYKEQIKQYFEDRIKEEK